MLIVYGSTSSKSSKAAMRWLNEKGIAYTFRNIRKEKLTYEEIIQILHNTNNGLSDILTKKSYGAKEFQLKIDDLKLSQAIKLLLNEADRIRLPILKDEEKLQIGFKIGEIGYFVPKEKRDAISLTALSKLWELENVG
ncbi:MAG: Spx/MgsR family RNA polymerase-binding regulatory protein [Streptococcaceae bacterium]|nr:Spx/MgsR family RNA polymerase-binding regulatory protein [Streptococcaceae bacterium]